MFQKYTIKHLLFYILLIIINIKALSSPVDNNIKKINITPIKPALQHAKSYTNDINIESYWVSEKLDGVRGYWNGKHLVTRNGNKIHTPTWFTASWPSYAMDGELWIARNKFEQVSGCIRSKSTQRLCWKSVKYMVFDLPQHHGDFSSRIESMKQLVNEKLSPQLFMVKQQKIQNTAHLFSLLDKTIEDGGEGLMLHLASANYQIGRNNNVLKLKRHQDAEARVISYTPGKGKYKGVLGSLLVQTPTGIQFKIGTGFSDLERANPPDIGSIITYKYIGKTQRGVPRFASFIRIKPTH